VSEFGVYSEVGRLRKVMVHRPELSLRRLTPSNKDELLFDDVLWVDRAQQQHDDFVALMRQEGVEVLYHQDLLAGALAQPGARESAVGRAVSALTVGPSMVQDVRQRLLADSPEELAAHRIGGVTKAEVEGIDLEAAERRSLTAAAVDGRHFVLPPLPNTLFQRDACWRSRARSWARAGAGAIA
jgi:arginine deiminase